MGSADWELCRPATGGAVAVDVSSVRGPDPGLGPEPGRDTEPGRDPDNV